MNEEEIDYWLKLFSDNNHAFMSKDGKKITLFKVFDKLKKLQQENKRLKMIIKEYERLNKVNNRGFKITNVKKYDIDELLSYKKYKDNWNELKEFIVKEYYMYLPLEASTKSITILINKMHELEQGSDSNE